MASAGEKPVMASKEGLMYSMMPLRSVIITVSAACSMARDSLSACFSMRVRSSISFSSLALERTRWRASDSAREVCLASVDKKKPKKNESSKPTADTAQERQMGWLFQKCGAGVDTTSHRGSEMPSGERHTSPSAMGEEPISESSLREGE